MAACELSKAEIDRRAKRLGLKPSDELRELARQSYTIGLRTAELEAWKAYSTIKASADESANSKERG